MWTAMGVSGRYSSNWQIAGIAGQRDIPCLDCAGSDSLGHFLVPVEHGAVVDLDLDGAVGDGLHLFLEKSKVLPDVAGKRQLEREAHGQVGSMGRRRGGD